MSLTGELRFHLRKVRGEMSKRGVNALYVSDEADLHYLSGRDTGRVLVTNNFAILWVKDVYTELYDSVYSCRGYPLEVRVYDRGDVKSTLRSVRAKSVAVSNPAVVDGVRRTSGKRVLVSDVVKSARSVKTKHELELIKKSCGIAKAGMRKARQVIELGVRELDAVAEIEAELRRRGSEKAAFGEGMLLASGVNSADIHAKPSFRRIRVGPVVVDLGATYCGYFSDTTRTFGVGSLKPEEKRVMGLVRAIKDELVDFVRPGMLASTVHKIVDLKIKGAGYRFHHLSGHGVGLEIHENPSFNPASRVRLKPGMVFTIEPGIYLPGKFGVRFEDTVVLTKKGCKKLT